MLKWLCKIFPSLPGCQPKPPKPPVPPDPPLPPVPVPPLSAELLRLHNAERVRVGLPPLVLDGRPMLTAASHAALMAQRGNLEHELPGEPDVGERLTAAGIHWSDYSENIAAGQSTTAEVVADWMNDPPHRRAILGHYTIVGFGVSRGADGWLYWCADFAAVGAPLRAGLPTSPHLPGGIDRRVG